MNYFWLDANAIAKRYVREKGTSIINHFFTHISPDQIICLFDSMDETRSARTRAQNERRRSSRRKRDPETKTLTAEELQKLLLADGIKPEENLGSRAIIEEREK